MRKRFSIRLAADAQGPGEGHLERDFLAMTESVRGARRFVLSAGWSRDKDTNLRIETLVSELATNAVLHARTPFHVAVIRTGDQLRVSVTDASREQPVKRSYAPTQPTGRGLRIVDALADRWGVDDEADGKTVWFEIDRVAATA
jgi:anti-sigma regulatory factor (Ser/Thr protein kinase)